MTSGMRNRVVAMLVLTSLTWASIPAILTPAVQPLAVAAQRPAGRHVSGHDHSCCPAIHSQEAMLALVRLAPAAMPCGDQHPCCARQGSDNLPALPAKASTRRLGTAELTAALPGHCANSIPVAPAPSPNFLVSSYSVRSTVLRI